MATSIDPKVLESLPQSVLDSIPGATPPPGREPLSPDPESLRTQTLVVGGLFLSLATAFFAIRAYVKVRINRKIALDDYVCTIGFALSIVQYGGITLAVTGGAGGYHMWDSSVGDLLSKDNTLANWLTTVFVTPALGLVKLTFLIQYYQLFWPLRWVRLCCWWGGGTAMFFYFATTITMFVLCSPWPGESWVASLLSRHYFTSLDLSVPTGAVGAAVDIFLLVLPVRAVISLQLAQRKKVALIFVFLTGALASIASLVGLAYRIKGAQESADAEWWVAHVWIWLQIEIFSGVAASCMPSLSKLMSDKDKGWDLSSLTPRKFYDYIRSSRSSKNDLVIEAKKSTDSQDTSVRTEASDLYLPKPSITSFNDPYFRDVPHVQEPMPRYETYTAPSMYTYLSRDSSNRRSHGETESMDAAQAHRRSGHNQGIRLLQKISIDREPHRGEDLEHGVDGRW